MKEMNVFKEITIGGITKEQLLKRLSEAGIQFNHYAHVLFDHPQFLPSVEFEKVKLVKVTLSDLNLKDTCSFDEFSNRIDEIGLKFCPCI